MTAIIAYIAVTSTTVQRRFVVRQFALDHVAVADRLRAARHDHVLVVVEAGDGEVALVPAALVQHAGVDGAAGIDGNGVGDQAIEQGVRVRPLDQQLGERAHVEDGDALAAGTVFLRDPRMPVLVAPAVLDLRFGGRRREEVGALPAHLGAEAGARVAQVGIQRRTAEGTGAFELAVGPGHLVVQAQHFLDAVRQPALVAVEAREAADVDRPQVERRLALHDPLGERLARASGRRDAHRVEAAADPDVLQSGRRAEDEVVVRGERFGTVVELLDLRGLERRDAVDRVFHQDLERIPVVRQQLELEVLGYPATVARALQPRRGVGLEAAHQQPAHLFLEVDVAVGIAHHREVANDAGNHVGDDIEVLAREERHGHAHATAHLARPLAAAQHDDVGRDRAGASLLVLPVERADAAPAVDVDQCRVGDAHAFEDLHAAVARALGERERQVGRIGLAVARQPYRALEVVGPHQRIHRARLGRPDHVARHAIRLGDGCRALQLDHPVRSARDGQRPAPLPAGRESGFALEVRVQVRRITDQPRHALVRAELTDETGRVPRGPGREAPLLQQHHVLLAELGQVIGDRAAHDAAADDHDSRRARWNGVRYEGIRRAHLPWSPSLFLLSRAPARPPEGRAPENSCGRASGRAVMGARAGRSPAYTHHACLRCHAFGRVNVSMP